MFQGLLVALVVGVLFGTLLTIDAYVTGPATPDDHDDHDDDHDHEKLGDGHSAPGDAGEGIPTGTP